MTSDKKNISLLADIFVKSGLSNIVISPGSRNAPIVLSFANKSGINAFTIVDERSAAFFALGMALQTGKTTAIACTSGSAVLNYASAISEAFYQKIPLLVLTADRPEHLIDVGDGQTIRQYEVFKNYVKDSYLLPENIETERDFINCQSIINKALNACKSPQAGPVHINIPFNEPLYNSSEETANGKADILNNKVENRNMDIDLLANEINSSGKVMIIAGQMTPNDNINTVLNELSDFDNIIILSETTSNLHGENFIDTIDNVVSGFTDDEKTEFKPYVLISLGGQIVSKMVKKFLRAHKAEKHFHISPSGEKMNTYFSLSKSIVCNEVDFLNSVKEKLKSKPSGFSQLWRSRKQKVDIRRNEYLKRIQYSDFKVFDTILKKLPTKSNLHLGNSTPVRYSQLFGSKKDIAYFSNRGVSGIDGQVSTAAGYSFYSNKLNILVTGDLGFFYDSNALMNKYLKSNLKIIIINNSGGGIFRFIPGPDTTPNLEEFFVAKHNWKAEFICKAFDIDYIKVSDQKELGNILEEFFIEKSNMQVLEIFTPGGNSAQVLREYFKEVPKISD
jgi:2-succinyl-5-enolpyruvyl-6-hydroxy-3-cyclohexene-1-carboxylate synthase